MLVVFTETPPGQPALATLGDLDDEVLDVPGGGWEQVDEVEPPSLVLVPGSVGDQAVEVRIQGQRTAEPLRAARPSTTSAGKASRELTDMLVCSSSRKASGPPEWARSAASSTLAS